MRAAGGRAAAQAAAVECWSGGHAQSCSGQQSLTAPTAEPGQDHRPAHWPPGRAAAARHSHTHWEAPKSRPTPNHITLNRSPQPRLTRRLDEQLARLVLRFPPLALLEQVAQAGVVNADLQGWKGEGRGQVR